VSTNPTFQGSLETEDLITVVSGVERPAVSLCSMITDWVAYDECRATFLDGGFDPARCEYLVVDNSAGNRADAYVTTNAFLQRAKGEYVVIHHQDVRLLEHGFTDLLARVNELNELDPDWAICGNAGALTDGWRVLNLSHPESERHIEGGPLPARVMSLDENFLVVKRAANLAASHDLSGFHHYGADLCLVADLLGWHAYVIDFFLSHLSGGTMDDGYEASRSAIARKYARAYRSRWVELVTNAPFYASGSSVRAKTAPVVRWFRKFLHLMPRVRDFEKRTAPDPARRRA
jgi:hypothetical protein